jgi:predicted O-methyltransferase YrrM
MGQIVPDLVERYLGSLNRLPDQLLRDIARQGEEQDLPLIDAEVGALLRVLATGVSARRILEIGTAVGYSGIWLAGALPADGMLLTMEMNEDRAQTAREHFRRAGLENRVSVMVGDAQRMVAKVAGPFDLIFQDGDKKLYTPMLDRLVALLRPGGLLVTDNVLWDGEVVPGFVGQSKRNVEDTRAIAEYNERLNSHPDLLVSTIPLRDGVAIAAKRPGPLVEGLAESRRALRGADFNDDARR